MAYAHALVIRVHGLGAQNGALMHAADEEKEKFTQSWISAADAGYRQMYSFTATYSIEL
jgi:hypothetical protein